MSLEKSSSSTVIDFNRKRNQPDSNYSDVFDDFETSNNVSPSSGPMCRNNEQDTYEGCLNWNSNNDENVVYVNTQQQNNVSVHESESPILYCTNPGAVSLIDDDDDNEDDNVSVEDFIPESLASFVAAANQTLVRSKLDFLEDIPNKQNIPLLHPTDDGTHWEVELSVETPVLLEEDDHDRQFRGEILNSLEQRRVSRHRSEEKLEKIQQCYSNEKVIKLIQSGHQENLSSNDFQSHEDVLPSKISFTPIVADVLEMTIESQSSTPRNFIKQPTSNTKEGDSKTKISNNRAWTNESTNSHDINVNSAKEELSQGSYDPVAWLDDPDECIANTETRNSEVKSTYSQMPLSNGSPTMKLFKNDVLFEADLHTNHVVDIMESEALDAANSQYATADSLSKELLNERNNKHTDVIHFEDINDIRAHKLQSSSIDDSKSNPATPISSMKQQNASFNNSTSSKSHQSKNSHVSKKGGVVMEVDVSKEMNGKYNMKSVNTPNAKSQSASSDLLNSSSDIIESTSILNEYDVHSEPVKVEEKTPFSAHQSEYLNEYASKRNQKSPTIKQQNVSFNSANSSNSTRRQSKNNSQVEVTPLVHPSLSQLSSLMTRKSMLASLVHNSTTATALSQNVSKIEDPTIPVKNKNFKSETDLHNNLVFSKNENIIHSTKATPFTPVSVSMLTPIAHNSAPPISSFPIQHVKTSKFTSATAERLSQPRRSTVYLKSVASPLQRSMSPLTKKSIGRMNTSTATLAQKRGAKTDSIPRNKVKARFTAASADRLSKPNKRTVTDEMIIQGESTDPTRYSIDTTHSLSKPNTAVKKLDLGDYSATKAQLLISREHDEFISEARELISNQSFALPSETPVTPTSATKRGFGKEQRNDDVLVSANHESHKFEAIRNPSDKSSNHKSNSIVEGNKLNISSKSTDTLREADPFTIDESPVQKSLSRHQRIMSPSPLSMSSAGERMSIVDREKVVSIKASSKPVSIQKDIPSSVENEEMLSDRHIFKISTQISSPLRDPEDTFVSRMAKPKHQVSKHAVSMASKKIQSRTGKNSSQRLLNSKWNNPVVTPSTNIARVLHNQNEIVSGSLNTGNDDTNVHTTLPKTTKETLPPKQSSKARPQSDSIQELRITHQPVSATSKKMLPNVMDNKAKERKSKWERRDEKLDQLRKQEQVAKYNSAGKSQISACNGVAIARQRLRKDQTVSNGQIPQDKENVNKLVSSNIRKSIRVVKDKQMETKPLQTHIGLAPQVSTHRRLTIPHSPKFATNTRLGPRSLVPVKTCSMNISMDSFEKGLRKDDMSIGSGATSHRKSLTVPTSPKFSTKSRSRAKPISSNGNTMQVSLAQSTDFLRKGLRDSSQTVKSTKNRGPTIPLAPKFQSITQRRLPKSTEEQDLEEMQRYISNPFKASHLHGSNQASNRNINLKQSTRHVTIPQPFKLHTKERKVAGNTSEGRKLDGNEQPEYKQFRALPMPSFSEKRGGFKGVPRVVARPVTTTEPFHFGIERMVGGISPVKEGACDVDKVPASSHVIEAEEYSHNKYGASPNKVPSSPTLVQPFHFSTAARSEKRTESNKASHRRVTKLVQEKEEQKRIIEESRLNASLEESKQKKLDEISRQLHLVSTVLSPNKSTSNVGLGRPLTEPEPFHFETDKRHESSTEKLKQRLVEDDDRSKFSTFKANPVPSTTYSPNRILSN